MHAPYYSKFFEGIDEDRERSSQANKEPTCCSKNWMLLGTMSSRVQEESMESYMMLVEGVRGKDRCDIDVKRCEGVISSSSARSRVLHDDDV